MCPNCSARAHHAYLELTRQAPILITSMHQSSWMTRAPNGSGWITDCPMADVGIWPFCYFERCECARGRVVLLASDVGQGLAGTHRLISDRDKARRLVIHGTKNLDLNLG